METSPITTSASPKKARSSRVLQVIVLLGTVFLAVGGLAYVTQYQRSSKQIAAPTTTPAENPLLEFTHNVAIWQLPDPVNPKNDRNFKEFETGMRGHYDFPFRNVCTEKVELGLDQSSCDCASIQGAIVTEADWYKLDAAQKQKPAEPFSYDQEPLWKDLPNSPTNTQTLFVDPGAFGVIRIKWFPRKSAGNNLNLQPKVWWQPVNDTNSRKRFNFFIPATMTFPVQFDPVRNSVGVLSPGGSNKVQIVAWSATRETLDFELKTPGNDSLIKIDASRKPMSTQERAELEKLLMSKGKRSHVQFAQTITVTVNEQKDGKQMDQGFFLKRLQVFVDGHFHEEIPGPEITGRVQGDITVGGTEDEGKIRFKSFESSAGAVKEVMLSTTSPNVKLTNEIEKQKPATLEVILKDDPKNSTPDRKVWRLRVIVPANTPAGSFDEEASVTLRIDGTPPRYLRIPIEGQVGGR